MASARRRQTALLLMICVFLGEHAFVSNAQNLPEVSSGSGRGTFGLLIITKDGMVFAADSRTTYGNGRHDDHAVKVFQLGSHSGCMIAGQVTQTPVRGRLGYNLVEEIVKTARRPGLYDSPTVFKGILEEGLSAAIRSSLLEPPKVASFDDDAEVASMLIGGYHIVEGGDTAKILIGI